jgi:Fur family transcriptional regulator, peroxide stress response regulator
MVDAELRFDRSIGRLKEGGHKITPQRVAIVRILAKSEGHPSVEDIYAQLHKDFPGISQATVYRTIMLIKSMGEVLELGFVDGSNRCDGNRPYAHPHLVCIRCKKILDPDLDTLKNMTKELAEESGFKIITYRLDFFGVCPDCQKHV